MSPSKYFNFAEAVAEAKRDFPKETEDVTFVDTSAPDAQDKLLEWARAEGLSQRQFDSMMNMLESQSAFVSKAKKSGHKLMAVPVERDKSKWGFENEKDKSAHFVFNHELGHLVVPECVAGDSTKSTEYREHAADTFAMMRCLQQGTLDKRDIAAKSNDRGHALLVTGDITHLTSMSLDAMVINPKNIQFLSLSPKEIIKIAQKHAATFEMDAETESRFLKVRRAGLEAQEKGLIADAVEQRLHALSYICLSAKPDSTGFYIAARILNNALETGHVKYAGETVTFDSKNEHWQHIRETIAQKSGGRDIGGTKALQTPEISKPQESGFIAQIKQTAAPFKV